MHNPLPASSQLLLALAIEKSGCHRLRLSIKATAPIAAKATPTTTAIRNSGRSSGGGGVGVGAGVGVGDGLGDGVVEGVVPEEELELDEPPESPESDGGLVRVIVSE